MHPYKELVHKIFDKESTLKDYDGLFFLGGILNNKNNYDKVIELFQLHDFEEAKSLFDYHTHYDNILFFLVTKLDKKYIVSVMDYLELLYLESIIDILPINIENVSDISYAEDID